MKNTDEIQIKTTGLEEHRLEELQTENGNPHNLYIIFLVSRTAENIKPE